MNELQGGDVLGMNKAEVKKSADLLKFKLDVELRVMKLMGVNSDETAMDWVNAHMDTFREIFDKEIINGFESQEIELLAQKIKSQIMH